MSNTRFYTAVIAFAVTFIFSAGLVRIIFGTPESSFASYNYGRTHCFSRHSHGIEKFIARDKINNRETVEEVTRRAGYNVTPAHAAFPEFADAVDKYAVISGRMEDGHLPQELRDAWRKHMNAWRNFADFLAASKDLRDVKSMSGEEYRKAEDRYNAEINRTWDEVLSLARSHGANVY